MSTDSSQIPRPPTESEGEGDELFDLAGLRQDVAFVLRAPTRHRRLAGIAFASIALLAAASSLVVPDVYQVQADILAQRSPAMLRGADWDAPTRAARETVVMRDNLIALCEQTGLLERHEKSRSPLGRLRTSIVTFLTGHEPAKADLTRALVEALEKRLQVWVTQEGTLSIKFEWPDPEIAFLIVEAAVQNFLETRHAQEMAALGETVTLLEARAAKLQQEVEATLSETERKARTRPRATAARRASRTALPLRRDMDVARLESTLNARRKALSDLEEFRQKRLAELQTQLAQKSSIYAERHPEVLLVRQSIAAMAQTSPQLETLRGEVRDLEREIARRGGQVAGAEGTSTPPPLPSDFLEIRPVVESDDIRLEHDREMFRFVSDEYGGALARLSMARMELETAKAAFKYRYSVISPPIYPKGPKRPYSLLRALGGILGGAAFAFFVTTAVDLWSGRIIEERQIVRNLGLSVLARFRP
jgi:uncharacterized protein involved in exopolysaccharide biosynthesis